MSGSQRRRPARMLGVLTSAIGAVGTGHLLLLLGAATRGRRRRPPAPDADLSVAVLIPAHDEEHDIAAAVASVRDTDYPSDRRRIIVIADNCSDRTAELAAVAGAEVWEREDPVHRGKGHALAWAFTRLLADSDGAVACVVDADCEVSANLLRVVANRIRDGADAVQVSYLVSDPGASTGAALRWAGFALFNVVRPLGRQQLGASAGLLGTGMAISRRLLIASPWNAFSFAEDREQHMRWALSGARVTYAPEAEVRSPAAGTRAARQVQEARWESGRVRLAVRLTPRLLLRAIRGGDLRALDAGLEPLLPPQSLLLATNLAALGLAIVSRSRGRRFLATAGLGGQVIYVVGGLALLRAPRCVWGALVSAPAFVARRLSLFLRAAGPGRPSEWERTARDPMTEPPSEPAAAGGAPVWSPPPVSREPARRRASV